MTPENRSAARSCPMCGGTSFTGGDFTPVRMFFRAHRPASLFSWLRTGYQVRGQQCNACGNIQFYANVASEGA